MHKIAQILSYESPSVSKPLCDSATVGHCGTLGRCGTMPWGCVTAGHRGRVAVGLRDIGTLGLWDIGAAWPWDYGTSWLWRRGTWSWVAEGRGAVGLRRRRVPGSVAAAPRKRGPRAGQRRRGAQQPKACVTM